MKGWARFLRRSEWTWLIGWLVAALAIAIPAPSIPTLLEDSASGFLPNDSPSRAALDRLRSEFPSHAPASRAVVVAVRQGGLTDADHAWIASVTSEFVKAHEHWTWNVHSPSHSPFLKPMLTSPDQQAAVMAIDLPAEMLTHSTISRVREIQRTVSASTIPKGLQVEITGSGALGELLDANTKRHIRQTKLWAAVAVSAILLLIYRSPVAMLLPIVTVAVSLMVSLGLIGWAASMWLPINGLVELFIIVLLGGCGVDYCLFLFARFREELSRATSVGQAVQQCVQQCGGAILGGATTNALGLATLFLAGNRDLYTSGPTISFALCVGTVVALTLTPSMMRIAGRFLLWPNKLQPVAGDSSYAQRESTVRGRSAWTKTRSSLWRRVGHVAVQRPNVVVGVIITVLIPPSIAALRAESLYDAFEEYPKDSSFVRGARLYYRHFFDAEAVSELSILVSFGEGMTASNVRPLLPAALDGLAQTLARDFPVAFHRDLNDPLGINRNRKPRTEPVASSWLNGARKTWERQADDITAAAAETAYIGRSGTTTRIDLGIRVDPRSISALRMVPILRSTVEEALRGKVLSAEGKGLDFHVDIAGESAVYADIRELRRRDFLIVAIAAPVVIGLVLWRLTKSVSQSIVLLGATLLTFSAAYGSTLWLFQYGYGLSGLNFHIDLLLFVIILSLGQDYNIFVVCRIQEELQTSRPRRAILRAVWKTGGVVSGCGVIMAASFGSLFAGSLLMMKEAAVALTVGILLDTFLVRPLLVPSAILLLQRRPKRTGVRPLQRTD